MDNKRKDEVETRHTRPNKAKLDHIMREVKLKKQMVKDTTEEFSSLREDIKIHQKECDNVTSTIKKKMDSIKKAEENNDVVVATLLPPLVEGSRYIRHVLCQPPMVSPAKSLLK